MTLDIPLAIGVIGCFFALLDVDRRVRRIDRARSAAATSEGHRRIWRSVAWTERRQAQEDALMAAIGDAPVQLYRREGRRYVRHRDVA